MIMKQEMQKSILKIQTAVETLTRQKVIDKNVYDFIHGEIKFLSESAENIMEVNNPDETLLTFTDKEKYVNQHINLADTSVLCEELNRRKEIGNDFLVISTEGGNWLIMEKKVLTLTVSKQWFDMIVSGEKNEEYRVIKDFWMSRLLLIKDEEFKDFDKYDKLHIGKTFEMLIDINTIKEKLNNGTMKFVPFTHVLFKNGYYDDSPKVEKEIESITIGKPKKGLCPGKWLDHEFFIIKFK